MTLAEIGTVSIAPEIKLNAPLAATTAGGVGIGAGIVIGAGVVMLGAALIEK